MFSVFYKLVSIYLHTKGENIIFVFFFERKFVIETFQIKNFLNFHLDIENFPFVPNHKEEFGK